MLLDNRSWNFKGNIYKDIIPAIGGDLIVVDNQEFYLFDPSVAVVTENKEYDPPATVEEAMSFIPPYKEDWMGDVIERSIRTTVQLYRTSLGSEPKLLFKELGQQGFWWTSSDLKKVYILTCWRDRRQSSQYLLKLWFSNNRGELFTEVPLNLDGLGTLGERQAYGVYFDYSGQYGYLEIDDYILQTQDAGKNWSKIIIPRSEADKRSIRNGKVDTLAVGKSGDLYFSIYKNKTSYLYKIPFDNTLNNLTQETPMLVLENRRVFSMRQDLEGNGLYLFLQKLDNQNNMRMEASYMRGNSIARTYDLGRFINLKDFFIGPNGRVVVTFEYSDLEEYIHDVWASDNYGEVWRKIDQDHEVISSYVDMKNNKYWQFRRFQELYLRKDIF